MTFNFKDIRKFLLTKNFPEWQNTVIDRKTGIERHATMEDFNYSGLASTTTLTFTTKHGTITKDVHITDLKFVTYNDETNIMGSGSTQNIDKVYSQDWINFLLHSHTTEYAKKIFDWSTRKIANIQQETNEKIKQFSINQREQAKEKIELYNQIATNAMNYLEDKDIVDIIDDINEY